MTLEDHRMTLVAKPHDFLPQFLRLVAEDASFHDVFLIGGRQTDGTSASSVGANSAVLAAISPVLKNLLWSSDQCTRNSWLILDGTAEETIRTVVRFCYGLQVPASQETVSWLRFFQIPHKMIRLPGQSHRGVPRLCQICVAPFEDFEQGVLHYKSHQNEALKKYCGRRCSQEKNYTCPICRLTLAASEDPNKLEKIYEHNQKCISYVEGLKDYLTCPPTCSSCFRTFSTNMAKRQHEKLCNKSFTETPRMPPPRSNSCIDDTPEAFRLSDAEKQSLATALKGICKQGASSETVASPSTALASDGSRSRNHLHMLLEALNRNFSGRFSPETDKNEQQKEAATPVRLEDALKSKPRKRGARSDCTAEGTENRFTSSPLSNLNDQHVTLNCSSDDGETLRIRVSRKKKRRKNADTDCSKKEIKCSKCKETFATKELKDIHTCFSIMDKTVIADDREQRVKKSRNRSLRDGDSSTVSDDQETSAHNLPKRIGLPSPFSNESEESNAEMKTSESSPHKTTTSTDDRPDGRVACERDLCTDRQVSGFHCGVCHEFFLEVGQLKKHVDETGHKYQDETDLW